MRRLHVNLALEFPMVVDVELNDVLSTPDDFWQGFSRANAHDVDQALFVAEQSGQCVAMGHVRMESALGRLGHLFVNAPARRAGIGTALASALVQWAVGAGATGLVCHIPDAGAGAGLAEKLGWWRTEEVFHTEHGLSERKWTLGVGGRE